MTGAKKGGKEAFGIGFRHARRRIQYWYVGKTGEREHVDNATKSDTWVAKKLELGKGGAASFSEATNEPKRLWQGCLCCHLEQSSGMPVRTSCSTMKR